MVKILRLELGYESTECDTCSPTKPAAWDPLLSHFSGKPPDAWSQPSEFTLPAGTKDDTWVGPFVESLVNNHIKSDKIQIKEGQLRKLRLSTDKPTAQPASGTEGTRCKLVGGKWINARSYRICYADGRQWPDNRPHANDMVFAELVWECWTPAQAAKMTGRTPAHD